MSQNHKGRKSSAKARLVPGERVTLSPSFAVRLDKSGRLVVDTTTGKYVAKLSLPHPQHRLLFRGLKALGHVRRRAAAQGVSDMTIVVAARNMGGSLEHYLYLEYTAGGSRHRSPAPIEGCEDGIYMQDSENYWWFATQALIESAIALHTGQSSPQHAAQLAAQLRWGR